MVPAHDRPCGDQRPPSGRGGGTGIKSPASSTSRCSHMPPHGSTPPAVPAPPEFYFPGWHLPAKTGGYPATGFLPPPSARCRCNCGGSTEIQSPAPGCPPDGSAPTACSRLPRMLSKNFQDLPPSSIFPVF